MIRSFLLYIFLFLFCSVNLFSGSSVVLPCDTISRHSDTILPVIGQIDGDELELTLEFNALDIDIKYVLGGTDYIVPHDTLNFARDFTNLESAKIFIKSENLNHQSDTLFFIQVRALLSENREFNLYAKKLKVDGTIETDADLQDGCLYLERDEMVIREENTVDVGLFYPNPTSYEAFLEFTIKEDTDNFEIIFFNGIGTQVCSIPDDYNSDEIKIFDLSGAELLINPDEKNTLLKGRYKMKLLPFFPKWAQGTYFVVLKVNGETHRANFIIQN